MFILNIYPVRLPPTYSDEVPPSAADGRAYNRHQGTENVKQVSSLDKLETPQASGEVAVQCSKVHSSHGYPCRCQWRLMAQSFVFMNVFGTGSP